MGRAPCCDKVGLKKGKWTEEEDGILIDYIKAHGEGSWRSLPKKAGLLRCGKSCRLRWINYLRTGLKRGNFSKEEEDLIIKLHASLGNRWSKIASQLPGRTDNEIKNYWNSHLSRSIHNCFHRVNRARNNEVDSVDERVDKDFKISQKNSEKCSETIARTATMKRIVVDKVLNPENSFAPSEFLNPSDEVLWSTDTDIFSRPSSPREIHNSDFLEIETKQTTSEFSCTADELSRSQDYNLSAIFKEMEGYSFDCETEEKGILSQNVQGFIDAGDDNMLAGIGDGVLAQLEQIQEEEAQLWDLDRTDFLWTWTSGLP